jgi:hypothetical protein
MVTFQGKQYESWQEARASTCAIPGAVNLAAGNRRRYSRRCARQSLQAVNICGAAVVPQNRTGSRAAHCGERMWKMKLQYIRGIQSAGILPGEVVKLIKRLPIGGQWSCARVVVRVTRRARIYGVCAKRLAGLVEMPAPDFVTYPY